MNAVLHVGQGDVLVAGADQSLSTILGSCVAICLFDPGAAVGGMIHYRLPYEPCPQVALKDHGLYGPTALRLLYDKMLDAGAHGAALQAKLFGGGAVVAGLCDIGQLNADFACEALHERSIQVSASDLGGTVARRVRFACDTGKAYVQRFDMPPAMPATN